MCTALPVLCAAAQPLEPSTLKWCPRDHIIKHEELTIRALTNQRCRTRVEMSWDSDILKAALSQGCFLGRFPEADAPGMGQVGSRGFYT